MGAVEPEGGGPHRERGVAPPRRNGLGTGPSIRQTPDLFVGRKTEVAEVAAMLERSRLVTITGPPGVGKTRLGLVVAAQAAPAYPDGVFVIELAALSDSQAVARALASALGLAEQPGTSTLATAAAHLAGRRALVVLDNCEHVVAACAEAAHALLGTCSQVSMLATSQEALAVAGEVAWALEPLSVPAPGEHDREVIASHGSVRLFVERASAASGAFTLSRETAPAVAEICRRLDGIPLAVELAAARVGVLSPAEIAARLEDRFAILNAGRRTAPTRHRSLEAALGWSHDLLDGPQRAVLRRLAVFAGGATFEAVEAVCAGGEVDDGVFEPLAALVARSLVVADTTGPVARYRLLETVRHYARDRLVEAGEAAQASARHCRWCLGLAEKAEDELCGPRQLDWLPRLSDEHDNLRSALTWALADGQGDLAVRLAGALSLFWRVRGHFSEGREWLEAALSAGDSAPGPLRAKALWGAGLLATMVGEFADAKRLADESLAVARQEGDDRAAARALLVGGNAWLYSSDGPATALALLHRSAAAATRASDHWTLAHALAMCGWVEVRSGDFGAAHSVFNEALAVSRKVRDLQSLGIILNGLGYVAVKQGDYATAETLLAEAIGVSEKLGDVYGTTAALTSMGELAIGRGHLDAARARLGEALGLSREAGRPHAAIDPLALLGAASSAEGDLAMALRLFEEATAAGLAVGASSFLVMAAHGQALLAAGDHAGARRLLDLALEDARASANRHAEALASYHLGNLHRAQGEPEPAATLHHAALQIRHEIGERPGVAASLEAVAGLAADAGRLELSARLLAGAEALRDADGAVRLPAQQAAFDAELAVVREKLSPERFEVTWSEGRAASTDQAVSWASKGRGRRSRPRRGWEGLTPSEAAVVALVAQGLRNRDIAERLFISPRTVQSHLTGKSPGAG